MRRFRLEACSAQYILDSQAVLRVECLHASAPDNDEIKLLLSVHTARQ